MEAFATHGDDLVQVRAGHRCGCLILLDTSSAVSARALASIQDGLAVFQHRLSADPSTMRHLDLGLVTYATHATLVRPMERADRFVAPALNAGGSANMGAAIEMAAEVLANSMLSQRRSGFGLCRPWLLLLAAAPGQDSLQRAASVIREGEASRQFAFFAVASLRANARQLSNITARPSMPLDGLRHGDLFTWLAEALGRVVATPMWRDPELPALRWARRPVPIVEAG